MDEASTRRPVAARAMAARPQRWSRGRLTAVRCRSRPARLLNHCAQLLAPGRQILVEAEPGNVDEQLTAGLEHSDGRRGPVFPWARLGTVALLQAAADAGLHVTGQWRQPDRAFVRDYASGAHGLKEMDCLPRVAPVRSDKRSESSERTGLTLLMPRFPRPARRAARRIDCHAG
jgi:hypothetical protein